MDHVRIFSFVLTHSGAYTMRAVYAAATLNVVDKKIWPENKGKTPGGVHGVRERER